MLVTLSIRLSLCTAQLSVEIVEATTVMAILRWCDVIPIKFSIEDILSDVKL